MALSIRDQKTERLARELAERTGETLTEALTVAIESRLAALERHAGPDHDVLLVGIARLQDFVCSVPTRETRSANESLGYDEFGLPT